jgi:hypothetical protein
MQLTKEEKEILTLMDGVLVNNFIKLTKKFVKYPIKQINSAASHLLKEGFVEIISLPSKKGDINLYYHTKKVKPDMLNSYMGYKKDFPYPSKNNRKFIRFILEQRTA